MLINKSLPVLFSKTLYYLGFLIPILYITGPFLSGLALTIFCLLFIFLTLYEKKFYFYKNFLFLSILFWSVYLIIISFFSINQISSLSSSLFYFRFPLMALGYWYLLEKHNNFLNNFTKLLTAVFIFLSIDCFFQFFFGYNIIGLPYEQGRASSFFGEEKILGSYISRLLPFSLIYFSIKYKNNINLKFLFILSLVLLSVIFAGERVAILYIFFTLIICFFIINSSILKKFLFLLFLFLMIIFINISSDNKIYNRIVLNTFDAFKYSNPDTDNKDNLELNTLYIPTFFYNCYVFSYDKFLENKLTGVGPKISRELFQIEINKHSMNKEYERFVPCVSHPHNTYIQLLLETGLLGTIPVFFLLLLVSYKLLLFILKNAKSYSELNVKKIYLLNCIFITLFPFVPTGNFFSSHLNILIYLPLGFILFLNQYND